jgi:hypothetical protein
LPQDDQPRFRTRRRFDYERRLLPNPQLASLEPESVKDPVAARELSGHTVGYPAWNLLYYSLLCSLPGPEPDPPSLVPNPLPNDVVILETGTNRGLSTIVMAQVIADVGLDAVVHTVDADEEVVAVARSNIEQAGLADRVEFNVGDSREFLAARIADVDHLDFVFLDDDHSCDHVLEEFAIVHPALCARRGTAYFDNTSRGGAAEAIAEIKARYGGNLVRFDNCSWAPPGNAIWQPD